MHKIWKQSINTVYSLEHMSSYFLGSCDEPIFLHHRGVFKTLSNVWDETFCENSFSQRSGVSQGSDYACGHNRQLLVQSWQ